MFSGREDLLKEYKNDQIIVYWSPELCAHSKKCIGHLPEVFDAGKRPWLNVNGSTPEKIIELIDSCPSGALKYSIPEGSTVDPKMAQGKGNIGYGKASCEIVNIKVTANGPLLIDGNTEIFNINGDSIKKSNRMALCRCGYSQNRPFCDGSHITKGWKPDPKE